jgi:GSH-dependent disulfide-bond oxidoreductase
MIDLYAMGSPNVVKIYIALEELGLAYRIKPVDVFGGAQFDSSFAALSPLAKVPVIVDEEGPGGKPYTVFESGTILLYLADKTGKLLPEDRAARFEAIQWLMVQLTGVGPMFGQFVHFYRFAPSGNDYSLSRYRTQVRRLCEALEKRLGQVAWLGGAEYSIADVATFPWGRAIGNFLGGIEKTYPNMQAWVDRIAPREPVKRALAAVADTSTKVTAFDKAKPEVLDRMFGRGEFALA